jgi:hypothetical protein
MQYCNKIKGGAFQQWATVLIAGRFSDLAPKADVPRKGERHPPSRSASACRDYSEEAIPERDPTFQLPSDTDCQAPTVEVVSAEARLDLARRLEQLGMSRTKAAALARL